MTATVDPVNPAISSAEDADSLAELGYTQELHRGIGAYADVRIRQRRRAFRGDT